ncbi:MAG: L-aspartate oxidase [Vampirovibrionales bacterium]
MNPTPHLATAPLSHTIQEWYERTTDVLMIGSGISGLYCALKLADSGLRVLIITKNALTENNSRYAQGGIAAVLPQHGEDSLAAHINDTLEAGAGLCEPKAVEILLRDGHLAIADLLLLGVPFDRNDGGELALTLEGGHGARRIIHAGGDATGRQVELTLTHHVEQHPNIECLPFFQAVQLQKASNGSITGALVVDRQSPRGLLLKAQATILATGGAGRLYTQTTNPIGATGNGFSLAYEAGCHLVDVEFVQFHPTAFVSEGQTRFLVSEAVRGEGGQLRTQSGKGVSSHPQGDLAPRDIVTRAIYRALQNESPEHQGHVWLDISHQSPELIADRFPTIQQACKAFGIEMTRQPIPVAPAAHYMMGGVAVTTDGYTGVPGLYAIGETIWTGLHGANRLASNSLLECVVGARNVALTLATTLKPQNTLSSLPLRLTGSPAELSWGFHPAIEPLVQRVREMMWEYVGVIRTEAGLTQALTQINHLQNECRQLGLNFWTPDGIDLWQQLQLARLITQSALLRKESRGAHYRSDFPETSSLPPVHWVHRNPNAPYQQKLSQPIVAPPAEICYS